MLKITESEILMGQSAPGKQDAIATIAMALEQRGVVTPGYQQGMQAREQQSATYLGNGIAIPHGTTETRDAVLTTALQITHFPDGVVWGNDGERAFVAIGIAARSDEHLAVLQQLTRVLSVPGLEDKLRDASSAREIAALLNGETGTLIFDEALVDLGFPVRSLPELVAVAAGKLSHRGAVDPSFVAQLMAQSPVYLGEGLWMVANHHGVQQSACTLITTAQAFEHEGFPVSALIAVAGKDSACGGVLAALSSAIYDKKIHTLLSVDARQIVMALTNETLAEDVSGIRRIFTIKNTHGLHARPSAILLNTLKKFDNPVWVAIASGEKACVDARNLGNLMGLGVHCGDQLEFIVEGAEAEAVLDAVEAIIASGLGEKL